MIKVATIIWQDGIGGAERVVRDIASEIDREKIDMRFYYLSGQAGQFSKEIAAMGFSVKYIEWQNGFSVTGRIRLIKALRHFNPMIVHEHIVPPFTRPLIKLLCRCPILHTEHGDAMRHAAGQDRWRRLLIRFDLLFCDRILANSNASRDAVQLAYQFSESKTQVLYPGIDLKRFQPNSNPNKKEKNRRIGFVGRLLNKHKGTDYLPRIARELLDRGINDVEFIVVGDGPDRLATEILCERLNVLHLFTFLGWRSDVQSIITSFDVLLVPSRFEAFGLSALEALAMGVKVVGFDVGGLRETVGENSETILVPSGNIDAMVDAVVSILEMPSERPNNSRDYVAKHFSKSRMASDLQQVYSEYAG